MTRANVQVTKVLLKRGNTAQNNSYTGVYGELSIDMEANALRIHDGVLPGGNVVSGSGGIGSGSYANANVKAYLTSFDGNILPSANVTYSLGSSTRQWKDLWVSNNTIYINSIPLSINNNGNLTINGNEIARGPQGNVGATGPQGIQGNVGPQGPQGNVGATGATGATGAQGPQGIQGNVGATGPQGIQGNVGATGAQGIQGIQGNVGPQGSVGAQGIQGNAGPQGSQGIQGIQGNVGEQGPRGFTGNTGEQGPQGERGLTGNTGAQGVSVTLLGSIDIVANLPMTANAGEGWIVQTDGDLYLWNTISSEWNNIGQIVGPQGDPGPEGPRGFTGNVGAEGPQGIQGDPGPQGEQGIQGNVGPQGEQGIQGNVGPQGDPGPQGEQGIQGNVGPQGEQGIQGNVGPQGATGPTGAQGAQGNAGVNGTNGEDGLGISNATVTSGNLIITLSDASTIDAGNVVGPQGPQGDQGPAGDPGGNANTGDFTFDATMMSVPNGDNIVIQAKSDIGIYARDGDNVITAEVYLDPSNGQVRLTGTSGENSAYFTDGSWDTAVWTSNGLSFTNAPDIISFLAPNDFIITGISVNEGDKMLWDGTSSGGGNITFYVDQSADPDPTEITNVQLHYRYESRIEIDNDEGELNLIAHNLDINIETTENIDIRATDSININSDNYAQLQSNSNYIGVESTGVYVALAGEGETNTWTFENRGALRLPAGGDIIDSNGQSVLGGNAAVGDFVFTNNEMEILDGEDMFIKAGDDLYLDALGDDAHVRADDDIRMRPNYNFTDDSGTWQTIFRGSGETEYYNSNIGATYGYIRPVTDNDEKILRVEGQDKVVLRVENENLGSVNVNTVDELVPPGNVWRLFISDSEYPTLGEIVQVGDTVTTEWGTPLTANITVIQQLDGDWQIQIDQDVLTGFDDGPSFVSFSSVSSKTWEFNGDGNLTLPTGGDILDSNGVSVLSSVRDTFNTLLVDGEDSLIAQGNDSVELIAGIGVTLTTNNTAPKSVTISADSLVNLDGGVASTVFDTPVLYAEGGGAGTRFGVNSPRFDGEDVDPDTIDFNLNGGRA